jgi:ABC-type polysaccharide/polyol phosphate transport system ATPase subunit
MKFLEDSEVVLSLQDISVRYRVPREKLSGIKEFAIRWIQRKLQYDDFWALHDVSFTVERGDVFGIVGRNGAGKSTLLKIMARVLYPTLGRLIIKGKVAPLLELGGGFHPELTGRENIYLNSALLGFSRLEIEQHLEEVIDFAEIRDFIDAPLRTYSTGMNARLGFSVATCIRPDILLIDEVLSVGDVAFQEKCIDRMNRFRALGTTIIIVSHDMRTIRDFCERALWLDQGRIQKIGNVVEITEKYIEYGHVI